MQYTYTIPIWRNENVIWLMDRQNKSNLHCFAVPWHKDTWQLHLVPCLSPLFPALSCYKPTVLWGLAVICSPIFNRQGCAATSYRWASNFTTTCVMTRPSSFCPLEGPAGLFKGTERLLKHKVLGGLGCNRLTTNCCQCEKTTRLYSCRYYWNILDVTSSVKLCLNVEKVRTHTFVSVVFYY